MEYSIVDGNNTLQRSFAFDIGTYNYDKSLILDPAVLVFCGYIGGVEGEWMGDISLDENGCIYITGQTLSDENSFPVKTGPNTSYCNEGDVYVAKLNNAGTNLIYCGYIGGNKEETSYSISVDKENW